MVSVDSMITRIATSLALVLAVSLQAQTILVKPYTQPGDGSKLEHSDVKVIAWVTDQTAGDFAVEYGPTTTFGKMARPSMTPLSLSSNQLYFKYAANLYNLPFDSEVHYRVKLGDQTIRQSSFLTRKTAENPIRFVVVGDTASGTRAQKRIAYQLGQSNPEFMLIVGDIVYSNGLVREYFSRFWDVYNNTETSGPEVGAPMMQSVPFYGVLGNHDVGATNLARFPDGLGAFYFFHPPRNQPRELNAATPLVGPPERIAAFKDAAGLSYPALNNYSFDNGPAHFLCLDANPYVKVNDPVLQDWIKRDLAQSQATWKFVFMHQPGIHTSERHYNEQQMRWLSPLFESNGVDVVFAGHVHNYQRSKPLRFAPAANQSGRRGMVNGTFTLDDKFDGRENTKADGIIYIVTGGGGANLYDTNFTDNPTLWEYDRANWAPFTTKFIADRHSFTVVEAEKSKLTLRQIDDSGSEVDRILVTKPGR
jgi:predicted phosphodiesterase